MVDLLEGMATTRAIRRYTDEPVTDEQLQQIMFAATRAPSGSNRQAFRFIVLRDSDIARQAKQLIASEAATFWDAKRRADGYDTGSGVEGDSPKARMARAMQSYVDGFADVPVLILPCLVRYRPPNATEGASVYPACQNLLLPSSRSRRPRWLARRTSRSANSHSSESPATSRRSGSRLSDGGALPQCRLGPPPVP